MDAKFLKQNFKNFVNKNVLIIGDVMVDAYLIGHVDRISPEAPVPVVSVDQRFNRMGGAANVALNIHALGAKPILCSVIGSDDKGTEFIGLMKDKGMITSGLISSEQRKTTTKFRVIGNNVQMLRVDEEVTTSLNDKDFELFIERIRQLINSKKIDVIIFEDYDKGVINERLIDAVSLIADEMHIPITVDPKKRNFLNYRNISLLKPNLKELREGLNVPIKSSDFNGIASLVLQLMKQNHISNVMVTLSENGVLLCEGDKTFHFPAFIRSISDVSGAGDTVISVLSLAMVSGFSLSQSAQIANLAGGLVCEEVGVVPVDITKLLNESLKLLCNA